MPPSSEQETKSIPVGRSGSPKKSHKGTPPSGSVATKKEKKNGAAKNSGGTPTVMKDDPKMSDATKPPPASAPSPSQLPDVTPVSALPIGTRTTSPLLDPLSSNAFNTSIAQNTTEWAKNVPAFSGSPGNLISLSGSPPTVPSSYEDRGILAGWNHRDRGISNGNLPSASPPTSGRRPFSFQPEGRQPFEDQASQKPSNTNQRSSMYSYHSQRYTLNPPLPHQPQAHFYGFPDPIFGIPSRESEMKAGTHGYHLGLDSLSVPAPGSSKPTDSVILSGYEGGLDVYAVSKYGLKKTASLDRLRGGVCFAKILPWTTQRDSLHYFPLVAVVLHGPVPPPSDVSSDDHTVRVPSEAGSLSRAGDVQGPQGVSASSPQENSGNSITYFQTTVEVYSLYNKKHISTLLTLPKIPLATSVSSPHFVPPPASGALTISADAGNVVVASGTTGEIWIYVMFSNGDVNSLTFDCTGKVWTTTQDARVQDLPRSPGYSDGSVPFSEPQKSRQQNRTPLFSLKGRWLAYSPPHSSSQVSLGPKVPSVTSTSKSPGLNSYVPPQTPLVNCAVDMPEGETLLNRIAREATQVALKGAKWVGDQGVQVWNSYWNKPTGNPQTTGPVNSGPYWPSPHPAQPDLVHGFPPTHGETLPHAATNSDPTLISILDIERLASLRTKSSAGSPHPFATFKVPLGCSFMSFSPSGLALFTASGKGEVQFVWDLMRIQYTKSSALQAPHIASLQGQHVRQVAIFTRMTPARIVDVVWTMPHGERIAMVTDRSTVHFWDLPATAFAWPPLRRRIKVPPPRSPVSGESVETPKTATAIVAGAASAAWSRTQPFIRRPRVLSGPARPGITAASMTAQAGQGGKALANGISKSFGAASGTIESFYKSGENRIRLPRGSANLNAGCIKWLGGQHKDYLATLADGMALIYSIKQGNNTKTSSQQISISQKPLKMNLPSIPDHKFAPAILRAMGQEDELDLTETEAEPRYVPDRRTAAKAEMAVGTESSIPQAEIESNAPYQPFHTDRRVGLYHYSAPSAPAPSPSVSALLAPLSITHQQTTINNNEAPWVFGRPIHCTKVDLGLPQVDDDDSGSVEDHHALPTSAMERVTTKIGEADEEVEQIVITTRRRKGNLPAGADAPGGGDDDGFFEDDCEVLDFASQRV